MNLNHRHVRYADLIPCKNAFIDTRSPGSDKKENFTIIGPGVAENPDQHVHISLPHGFNIGGARQPPGCLNSQHSHLTEEVFIVHSGSWAFRTGVNADDGEIVLNAGDIISLPTDIFRGFENVGEDLAFLFAILGGDDPGRVLWAPSVFEMAKDYGLILLENGALVDTNLGQSIPDGLNPMPVTSEEQIAAHKVVSDQALNNIVIRATDFAWCGDSVLAAFPGAEEAPLIGRENPQERLAAAKLAWDHDFVVRALKMQTGTTIPAHRRAEEEVIFVQSGTLTLEIDDQPLTLEQGDTFTTPINATRTFCNNGNHSLTLYITRRGNSPTAPVFV